MDQPFVFLLKLAWDARLRIPLIIVVAFMAFDIRMHLDINVHMRRVPRVYYINDEGDPEDDEYSWVSLESDEDSSEIEL